MTDFKRIGLELQDRKMFREAVDAFEIADCPMNLKEIQDVCEDMRLKAQIEDKIRNIRNFRTNVIV